MLIIILIKYIYITWMQILGQRKHCNSLNLLLNREHTKQQYCLELVLQGFFVTQLARVACPRIAAHARMWYAEVQSGECTENFTESTHSSLQIASS